MTDEVVGHVRRNSARSRVRLVLTSEIDLSALVSALSRTLFCIHDGFLGERYVARLSSREDSYDLDREINVLSQAVLALEPVQRASFDSLNDRRFDVSVEIESGNRSIIRHNSVAKIVQLGASLTITLVGS